MRALLLLSLLAAARGASLSAQSPSTGMLQGRVSDSTGQPVSQTEVLAAAAEDPSPWRRGAMVSSEQSYI